jgi:hypothetical protein
MTRLPVPQRLSGALALAFFGFAALAALPGCDDGGTKADSGTTPADDIAGTWRYLDVSSVVQCPDSTPLSVPPDPNKVLVRGIDSALVDLSPSPLLAGVWCDIAFDVTGPVATAQPNQVCTLTALDSFTIDQPEGGAPLWTFTLNSATTAEELVTATIHYVLAGQPTTCSWSLVGHLKRISKD